MCKRTVEMASIRFLALIGAEGEAVNMLQSDSLRSAGDCESLANESLMPSKSKEFLSGDCEATEKETLASRDACKRGERLSGVVGDVAGGLCFVLFGVISRSDETESEEDDEMSIRCRQDRLNASNSSELPTERGTFGFKGEEGALLGAGNEEVEAVKSIKNGI